MIVMISKAPWKWIPLGILLAQCLNGFSEPVPFDRYGVILDRKPFGDETVPEPLQDPAALQVPPEKSFTAKFKIVAVTRNSAGVVQVGLVDLKSNRSTLLGVGDTIEGVEVLDADYVTEKARLRRDPEDYWVSMIGGSNHFELVRKEAPATVAAAPQPPAPVVSGAGGKLMRTAGRRSSYAERRQSREEARIRAELERLLALEAKRISASKTNAPATSVASVRAAKTKVKDTGTVSASGKALMDMLGQMEDSEMTPEEVNAYLQEYQKELIRAGQTPLPIPLTPETDQALVEEGVLPAQE